MSRILNPEISIRPQRTVAAFGRHNAAFKAAHLFSISLFRTKSSPILDTRTHRAASGGARALAPVTHGEIVCTKIGILSYKREIKKKCAA